MTTITIPEDKNKLLSRSSEISKAGNINISCGFQNLQLHHFEQEKQD